MTNMRRGLWRLWIGGSGLWVIVVLLLAAVVFAGPVAHKDFLDNCPDLKIPATNTRSVEEWSDEELITLVDAANAAERRCVVRYIGMGTTLAVTPPTVFLLLGLLVAWIVRGFRTS